MALGPSQARRLAPRTAFVVASLALVVMFAAAGSPIPLYNLYRADDGVSFADLSLVTVGYLAAAATALLVLGRLSNHLGRRPVAIAAIALAILACLLLMLLRGPGPLLVARILQGLSSGIASGALGAYVVDTSRDRPSWLPAAITGSAPMVGIPAGALASGALVQYGTAPKVTVFLVMLVALAACLAGMLASPETLGRQGGAWASLRPRLQVPAGSLRLVLTAGAASVATWSLGSFFQAFGPAVVAGSLGTTNALAIAAAFSCFMVLTPLGGPIGGRLAPATGVRLGMMLYVATLSVILVSLFTGALLPFLAASLLVGIAQGIASTAGIRALLAKAGPHERAGLLSTLYLIAYAGAAVPGLVAGQLTTRFELRQIAVGYAALGVTAAVVACLAATNPVPRDGGA